MDTYPLHHVDLVRGRFHLTTARDLKDLFDHLGRHERGDNLVVHFHGGLVHGGVADEDADDLRDVYLERGRAYPVFWVWNSGFMQMQEIFADAVRRPKVRDLIRRLSDLLDREGPALTGADGADDDAPSPRSWPLSRLTRQRLVAAAPLPGFLGAWREVLARVLARRGTRALQMVVAEEVLRANRLGDLMIETWAEMKRTIDAAFGPEADAGGTAFLELLDRTWTPARRVTLVGHSAGAIYILRLLKAAHAVLRPEVRFDVVLLAPACTFAEAYALRHVLRARVRSLQMFSLRDDRESAVYEENLVYPGSILYLVSGLLEERPDTPILGMQRFHEGAAYAQDPAVAALRGVLAGRTVWTPAEGGPLPSDAGTHARFDDHDGATIASVCRLLAGEVAALPFPDL